MQILIAVLRAVLCGAALVAAGCSGGSGVSNQDLLRQLRDAIDAPVGDQEVSYTHSRLVEDVVEEGALEEMTRPDVEAAIGRGDQCSRHPRCAEQGFEDDDWFYNVGQMGGFRVPILIVGFDRFGTVTRTWHLRTH